MENIEVRKRIEEAKVSNQISLDLCDLNLKEIPSDVYLLTSLKRLKLSRNHISTISENICNLINLESLELDSNKFVKFPVEVFFLKDSLKLLNLSSNYLSVLPDEISKLIKLEELHISSNEISALPTSFRRLKNLKHLYFRFCDKKIKIIPNEIFRLRSLETLYLSSNGIQELSSGIGRLINLKELYLDTNEIKKIPNEIVNLKQLEVFDIRYNYQLDIPHEILKTPKNAQKIINYFSRTQKGHVRPLNEAKIVVVGEANFGKSLLIRRLVYNDYIDTKSTQGIKIERWKNVKINDQDVQLNIWDFGGQEIMHSTHQFFFTKRTIYILVINARQNEDLDKTEEWLKRIESFGGDSPILIVGSKIDENQRNETQKGHGYFQINDQDISRKFKNIKGFYGVCSNVKVKEYDNNWEIFKEALINEISKLPNLHQPFPSDWFAIKDELEAMREKQIPHISNRTYLANCIQKEVNDEISQDTIREFLNEIGTVIYFEKLFDKMIFNPEWITNGVYALVDNPSVFQNQGVLKFSQLDEILTPKGYKPDEHKFILDLMKEFELCVEIEKGTRFLIPDLLSNVKETYTGEWKNTLGFQYHYKTYLKNIFTKFVVRMYPYIYKKTWWNNGVVLALDSSKAYVKFDSSDKKAVIKIDGENLKKRQNLLAIIRKEFADIHKDFASLDVSEFVVHPTIKVIDKDDREKELLKDYDELIAMEEIGKTDVFVKELKREVAISDWLDGIERKEHRHQTKNTNSFGIIEYTPPIQTITVPEKEIMLQNKILELKKERILFEEKQRIFDEDAQIIARVKAYIRMLPIALVSFLWIVAVIYFGWDKMEIWTWVTSIIVGLFLTGLACWFLDDNYFPLLPSKILQNERDRIYNKHKFNVKEKEHIEQELIKTKRELLSLK